MSGSRRLTPSFVEFIPDELEPGVLYVSMEYATCVHLCACGCGHKAVTPLAPFRRLGWTLTFDGEAVSLSPSIGNWNFPCKSHYWVRNGEIRWDARWTPEQIERHRREEHDLGRDSPVRTTSDEIGVSTAPARRPWWRRLFGR